MNAPDSTGQCAYCGQTFVQPKKHRRKSCSSECRTKLQSRHSSLLAKSASPERKRRLAEIGRQFIEKARAAHKNSPRSGPFETHHEAKFWKLESPEGEVFEFRNLNHFCREKFGDKWRAYSNGIHAHARWVRGLRTDTNTNYKGWKVVSPASEKPVIEG